MAVVVFGTGVYVHFSAPRHSIGWLLLVLLLTFGAQRLAASVFNIEMSGFFGMLVATPLGYLIQHRFKGPPAIVTYLPSFWLVVPGSLGLHSVTRMLSDRMAGIEGLVGAIFAIASIALGTLVGASLYKGLDEHVRLVAPAGKAHQAPRPQALALDARRQVPSSLEVDSPRRRCTIAGCGTSFTGHKSRVPSTPKFRHWWI